MSGRSISVPARSSISTSTCLALVLAAGLAGEARAQTASAPDEDTGEIVVTAQKRTERLLDVPQSVTVLSPDKLAANGATQFRDFADTIPGLSFQSSGTGYTQISLRGVTVGQDAGATVAIYVDDVPYGSSTSYARGGQVTLDVGLADLERIEVLRGPQGTLYGASSMGGIIKYVTKAPDLDRIGGHVLAGAATTDHGGASYSLAGSVNLPLQTDRIALRLGGFHSHDGGYADNLARNERNVNSSDVSGVRADLLFAPTDRLRIRLAGFAQNIDRDGFPFGYYQLNGVPQDGPLTHRRPLAEPFKQKFRLVSGTIEYDLGPATLTSISSYQTTHSDFVIDLTLTSLATFRSFGAPTAAAVGTDDHTRTRKFTQEIRLASPGGERFEWLIGGYLTREKSEFFQDSIIKDATGADLPNNVLTFSTPTRYNEDALFGNLTFNITDRLSLSGGLRYAHNSNRFQQFGTGSLGRTSAPFSSKDGVFTYLANAKYKIADNTTAYLRYATGYRPGGPNVVLIDPNTGQLNGLPVFEPDTLKSYEAGFKSDLFDRRLSIDAAVYHLDWDNIIVTFSQGGFSAKTNVPGGARINGLELSATARPFEGFTASASFAYQDAKLREANTNLRAAKGERLPSVPKTTASFSADYTIPGPDWAPTLGATLKYIGARNSSFDASTSIPQYRLPSYTTIDARANFPFGAFDLAVYVRNLIDERGQLLPRFTSPRAGPIILSITQPRTFGFTVSRKF
jgi:outer membrane receptor protein involved in Fe transport